MRAQVEAVAHALGYAGPDPRGRILSSGKVNAIGVVSYGEFGISLFFKSAYMRDFLAGIVDICEERGVGVCLVPARNDAGGWGIKDALVDGFIFNALEQVNLVEPARRRQLPFVVTDTDGGADISSVRVENRDGAKQLVRHLLGLGHRRFVIGVVLKAFRPPIFHAPGTAGRQLISAGPSCLERVAGIAEALAEAGLSINDVPIIEACGTPEEAAAFGNGAAMILDKAPEATAVVALSDSLALSVLEQAKLRGISVPNDLSIVGFDDIAEAALADPPLTTIHQSAFQNGRMAARLLLDGGPARQVVLPVSLVVRGSTAPPRR